LKFSYYKLCSTKCCYLLKIFPFQIPQRGFINDWMLSFFLVFWNLNVTNNIKIIIKLIENVRTPTNNVLPLAWCRQHYRFVYHNIK
jgi:hypothetical protein